MESYRDLSSDTEVLAQSDLENTFLSAATVSVEYDSRDFELNAHEGMLFSVNWNAYRTEFGSIRL
jgi:outer membrane protein assembly factor BamA